MVIDPDKSNQILNRKSGEGIRVLIIDDENPMQRLFPKASKELVLSVPLCAMAKMVQKN